MMNNNVKKTTGQAAVRNLAAPERGGNGRSPVRTPVSSRSMAASSKNAGRPSTGRTPGMTLQVPGRRKSPGKKTDAAAILKSVLTDRERRLSLISGVLVVLLIVYTALVMRGNAMRNIDFSVIQNALEPYVSELVQGDANALDRTFGVEGDELEGWLYYSGESIMDIETLLVVKCGADDVLDALEEGVNGYLEEQKATFESYGTDQGFWLDQAILWRKGAYMFFGVGEKAEQWQERFLACVR